MDGSGGPAKAGVEGPFPSVSGQLCVVLSVPINHAYQSSAPSACSACAGLAAAEQALGGGSGALQCRGVHKNERAAHGARRAGGPDQGESCMSHATHVSQQ